MQIRGWVYVITNPAMPGLVKIGHSTKDPLIRARDLGGSGVPHPFQLQFDAVVLDPEIIERSAHRALGDRRDGKEWFKCTIDEAVAAILDAAGESLIFITDRRRKSDDSLGEDADSLRHTRTNSPTSASISLEDAISSKGLGNTAPNRQSDRHAPPFDCVATVVNRGAAGARMPNNERVPATPAPSSNTPLGFGTRVHHTTCKACATEYTVTLSRGENQARCPKCRSLSDTGIAW